MTGLSQTEQQMFDFWRARLDDDDVAARDTAAEYGTAWSVNEPMGAVQSDTGADVVDQAECPLLHIARYDPSRALREVTAARARMERLEEAVDAGHDSYDLGAALLPYELLPYADHPDYKEAWRP